MDYDIIDCSLPLARFRQYGSGGGKDAESQDRKNLGSQERRCAPVIPTFGRLEQEKCEFKSSLDFIDLVQTQEGQGLGR